MIISIASQKGGTGKTTTTIFAPRKPRLGATSSCQMER
jgi:hypothetical protein